MASLTSSSSRKVQLQKSEDKRTVVCCGYHQILVIGAFPSLYTMFLKIVVHVKALIRSHISILWLEVGKDNPFVNFLY